MEKMSNSVKFLSKMLQSLKPWLKLCDKNNTTKKKIGNSFKYKNKT